MECDLGIDENEHNASIMKRLDDMRKEKQNCDFIIRVESHEFHVDRKILMAASDYFVAMFSHDTLEKNNGIVEMKEVDVDSVKLCIDYIYTGKASITLEKCEHLLHVASLMQLSVLCEKITDFVKNKLDSRSFFHIRNIAINFDNKTLKEYCDEFALQNLGSISKEDQFKSTSREYLSFLIGSENMFYTADAKLAILLQWIKADLINHSKYFMGMASKLNMSKLSPEYSMYLVENETLCNESAEFMKIMFVKLSSETGIKSSPAVIPGSAGVKENTLVVFDNTSEIIEAYYPNNRKWRKLHNMHEGMLNTGYTAVILDGFLYVLLTNSKVYCIKITEANSAWRSVTSMLKNHSDYMRAATYNDKIYVCGNNSIEIYHVGTNQWDVIPNKGIPCSECALVMCNGLIYIIGGKDTNNKSLKSVYRSSLTSFWISSAPMKVARQTPGVAVHNEMIYVAGGYVAGTPHLSDTECYDSKTDSWITLAHMAIQRENFALCLLEDRLYAVGGEKVDLKTIENYDITANKWVVMETLANKKIRASATVAMYLPLSD